MGRGNHPSALALARLLGSAGQPIPSELRTAVDFRELGVPRLNLLPVLVTGSREPLAISLLRALATALEDTCNRGKKPHLVERVRVVSDATGGRAPSDAEVIALIGEAVTYIRESEKAAGVLIILDEMGKFLEYAALHPDRQDVYFLQQLAEAAARSGDAPLLVVGLLHQGFHAYAERLSYTAQKEWEKVAGRFEEVLFNQPLEQTAALVAAALNLRMGAAFRAASLELLIRIWHGQSRLAGTVQVPDVVGCRRARLVCILFTRP